MGLVQPLWRAIIVFRIAALGYAVVLLVGNFRIYAHPLGGWIVIAVMAGWTAVMTWGLAAPQRRGWSLLTADLVVAAGCLLSSRWIVEPDGISLGAPTLPMAWVAGPVLAWAVKGGRRLGLVAAAVMGAVDGVVRGAFTQGTINGTVLMLLAGAVMGHMARLATAAEIRMHRAVELEAITRERERLARGIHDSVLQVLSLVQRRGAELGGEAAELGRLAGQQEATLRALVATTATSVTGPPAGWHDSGRAGTPVDLRPLLDRRAGTSATVAAPATPVWLPDTVADEITAAVGSALDNVTAHAGPEAKAWVLLEEEADAVTVTVRDNGTGFDPRRLADAETSGRLGVAQSIRGRMRDLGGTVQITAAPGRGTEVELRIPRVPSAAGGAAGPPTRQ